MTNKLLSFAVALTLLSACSQNSAPHAPQVDSTAKKAVTRTVTVKKTPTNQIASSILSKPQAEARLAAGATLFDARTAEEFATGHPAMAINVPLELLGPTLPALDSYKDKEILIVGKDEQQVETMRQEMLKAGFKTVLNAYSLNS